MKKRYFVSGYEEMPFKDLLVLDENSNMKIDYSRWIDCTKELENMKEIDREQHDTLYKTKDAKVLIHKSEVIAFLPEDIETVDEAREYIQQELEDFFGYM